MTCVGIAADHGGFILKEELAKALRGAGYEVVDLGAHQLNPGEDYPNFIIPLAKARRRGGRLSAAWRSAGAAIAANKVPRVRAGLILDVFAAHRGVEDDDMNVFCLGGR